MSVDIKLTRFGSDAFWTLAFHVCVYSIGMNYLQGVIFSSLMSFYLTMECPLFSIKQFLSFLGDLLWRPQFSSKLLVARWLSWAKSRTNVYRRSSSLDILLFSTTLRGFWERNSLWLITGIEPMPISRRFSLQ